jgi:Leucine-rich repeat (LRR) protein
VFQKENRNFIDRVNVFRVEEIVKAKILFQETIRLLIIIAMVGISRTIPNQAVFAKPFMLPFTNCAAQTEIPAVECEALVALYNSTDGAHWKDSSGWLQTNTPCSWYGVTCTLGYVSVLNLLENQLSGTIPSQLGNLTSLMELEVEANQLSGPIPSELGNLTDLRFLLLTENQLTGPIPPELGNLTNLIKLNLYNNQLTGSIPPEIGSLTHLNYLYLSYNQLTGSIPPELGSLTNLRELFLDSNLLTGSIPPELGSLHNLIYLQLGNNQLSGFIPRQLGNMAHLEGLGLTFNQLTGSIPPALGNNKTLMYVDLGNNQLSGSISSEFGNLTNLTWLKLNNNRLSGSLPPELGNSTNLEWLDLENNQLNGSIPPELGNLTKLWSLVLGENQFSGSIPAELGNLTKLQTLALGNNPLGGPFPESITNLADLTYFSFNCGLNSSDPDVIAFVDKFSPGWHDQVCPVIASITRNDPNPTWSANVDFTVTFSEPVTGADPNDFSLTTTMGLSGAAVIGVSGAGDTYTVRVDTGSGGGKLRLDVTDDDSIINSASHPLGGVSAGNGDFIWGETYDILYKYYFPLIFRSQP